MIAILNAAALVGGLALGQAPCKCAPSPVRHSSQTVVLVAYSKLPADEHKDILGTAAAAGSFKTLAAALGAADLTEALGGAGPFTVFAPTDEAFAKLPKEALADLLKPENKAKLQAILKYHVVAAKATAKDAVGLEKAKTLEGKEVTVKIVNGQLMVNDAKAVKTDIMATNGVIHVVDTVLMPPS